MMKKGFGKGFCSGILVAALTVGLGVSAMAASRTITVDDNIRITLNGAVFSPKDAKGRDVPLFSYNGTTYAPVRAICEAAGLKVDFDSANYTAVLTTPDRYIASTPSASNYISVDKAKEIALNHAGVKAADAIFVKAGLDWDDGRTEYEVEFYAGNTEYDYSIDATTGAIRSYDHDWDDFSLWNPGNNAANPSTPGTSTNNLISEAKAKEIALAKAPPAPPWYAATWTGTTAAISMRSRWSRAPWSMSATSTPPPASSPTGTWTASTTNSFRKPLRTRKYRQALPPDGTFLRLR
mgnify:CR=1 FL=1